MPLPESIGNRVDPLPSQVDVEDGGLHVGDLQKFEGFLDTSDGTHNFGAEIVEILRQILREKVFVFDDEHVLAT